MWFFHCRHDRELERRLHRLENEFEAFRQLAGEQIMKLSREVTILKELVISAQTELHAVQEELKSGMIPNPELRRFLEEKLGKSVTITVTAGTLAGIVIQVSEDSVEIREATGELVLIPFSQISAVQ